MDHIHIHMHSDGDHVIDVIIHLRICNIKRYVYAGRIADHITNSQHCHIVPFFIIFMESKTKSEARGKTWDCDGGDVRLHKATNTAVRLVIT